MYFKELVKKGSQTEYREIISSDKNIKNIKNIFFFTVSISTLGYGRFNTQSFFCPLKNKKKTAEDSIPAIIPVTVISNSCFL